MEEQPNSQGRRRWRLGAAACRETLQGKKKGARRWRRKTSKMEKRAGSFTRADDNCLIGGNQHTPRLWDPITRSKRHWNAGILLPALLDGQTSEGNQTTCGNSRYLNFRSMWRVWITYLWSMTKTRWTLNAHAWAWHLLPVIFLVVTALVATPGAVADDFTSDSGSISQDNIEDAYSWGPWGHVTSCTRTCGTGVRYRRRVCYKVIEGGMELADSATSCSGQQTDYQLCPDLPECDGEEGDFRDQQCAAYNSQPYRGRLYRWEAYRRTPDHTHTLSINPCSLVCCTAGYNTGRHLAVRFSTKVRDGTSCDLDLHAGSHLGVCINATCVRIGCDGGLHSDLVFDRCGVCGGNNHSCLTISGNLTRTVSMGYTDVVTVPPGASSIRVIETVDTSAVFALRSDNGILFVNGRSSESYPTVYRHVAGIVFRYHHSLYSSDGLERLEGTGRTNETLYIMMLQPEDSGGEIHISYEYSIPRTLANASGQRSGQSDVTRPNVQQTLNYERRPETTETPRFVPEHGGTLEEYFLSPQSHGVPNEDVSVATTTADPSTSTSDDNTTGSSFPDLDVGMPGESVPAKVGSKYRNPQTNSGPYRYFWKLDKLAPCSATCTSGVQSRSARCYRSDNVVVESSFCEDSDRPRPVHVSCEGRPCSPRWVASLWSSCSVSCGTGQQYRTVHCWRMMAPGFDSTVHDYLCSTLTKPYLARPCKEVDCGPLWETSMWGECSRKCGAGVQARNVRCSSQTQPCDVTNRPRMSRPCHPGPCVHDWVVSDWGECSGGCARGSRKRSVTCRDEAGNFLHDKFCDQHTRPLSVEACTNTATPTDCPLRWVPQDWGVCSVDCDWGETSRTVVCGAVHAGMWRKSEDVACREMRRPRMRAACREPPCKARWYTTDWSQCSKSCGEGGVRVRKVACYRDNRTSSHCDVADKPSVSEPCEDKPCHTEPDTAT